MTRPILRLTGRERGRPRGADRRPAGAGHDPEHHRFEEAAAAWRPALRAAGLTVESSARTHPRSRRPRLARRGDAAHVPAARHRARRAAGGRRIVLSGHSRRGPAGDPATWTVDPWARDRRDGALYGRGACDMKGGIAAIPGRGPHARRDRRPRSPRRRAGRCVRAVRGGRRPGTLAAIRAGFGATSRSSPSPPTSTSWSPMPVRSRSG